MYLHFEKPSMDTKEKNKHNSRRHLLIRSGLTAATIPLLPLSCKKVMDGEEKDQDPKSFEFAFLTDIHIKPELNAPIGFQMAIDMVNTMKPDFVLTGGVLYMMQCGEIRPNASLFFFLYTNMSAGFQMPVHNCIGNHDLFGIYEESPESDSHPDYKYGMWERYFGKTYYSFDHKGWHFITLNSLDVTEDKRYARIFHKEQLMWLKNGLRNVERSTPIVITTHIPMICTYTQLNGGNGNRTVNNALEVFKILEHHNLKLVLQGHIHWKEFGYVNDRFHFLTGGSIAGNGWKGRRHNTKEGFVRVKVTGQDFSWDYIDHSWEAKRHSTEAQKNS